MYCDLREANPMEEKKAPSRDKKVTPKKLTKKSDASEEATEEDK